MRRHNAYDAAHARIQTGCNDAQNDIFASEDAGNLGMSAQGGRRLHDTDCSRPALAHETRNFPNSGSWANHRRLSTGVHHGCKVGQGCFFAQSFHVGKHGCRLGVCAKSGPKLGLHTSECTVQLLRCRRTTLDLVQGFMKNFSYVEQTNDVAIFVANWLGYRVRRERAKHVENTPDV